MVAELIGGELYAWPRPARAHSRVHTRLVAILERRFDDCDGGPGGWWIALEPELHLALDVVVPDIGGWRRESVPEYPDTSGCTIAPDWVCEILSPSTAKVDRVKKQPLYAQHGIAHLWLIDPIAQTLSVLRLEHGRWVVAAEYGGDQIVRAEPFDAVELNLADLWLTPPSPQS